MPDVNQILVVLVELSVFVRLDVDLDVESNFGVVLIVVTFVLVCDVVLLVDALN